MRPFGFGIGLGIAPNVAPAPLGDYLPEAKAVFDAFSSSPNGGRRSAINDLISGLQGSGVWSKLDVLYVFAAADAQAALINWKNPGTYDCAVNSGSTVNFSANQGYTSTGSNGSSLVTGYQPQSGNTLGYSASAGHMGTFVLTDQNSTNADIGMGGSANRCVARGAAGQPSFGAVGGGVTANSPAGEAPHHFIIDRSSTTSIVASRNGLEGTVATTSSGTTWPTAQISICAGTSAGIPTTRQQAIAHIGQTLTSQNKADLYDQFRTYLIAVGVTGL